MSKYVSITIRSRTNNRGNIDNIEDVIHGEVCIVSDDMEEMVIANSFMHYVKSSHEDIQKILRNIEVLSNHFLEHNK